MNNSPQCIQYWL